MTNVYRVLLDLNSNYLKDLGVELRAIDVLPTLPKNLKFIQLWKGIYIII